MGKLLTVLFLILFALSIGCGTEELAASQVAENETVLEIETMPEPETADIPVLLPAGACEVGWKCISSQMKAYRNESCGFGQRVQCPLGCLNDTCRAASTCTSGFKCINDHRKGYQLEACTWINDVECPGGCEEGECLFYNASATAETTAEETAEESSAPPPDTSRTLQMGQQDTVIVGEAEHIISLSILEQSQVKFTVDGFKTDWLEEGEHALIRGLTITVKEILFQAYDGGKQQVRYTVE